MNRHLALYLEKGWGQWLGGLQYLRNIIFALSALPPKTREQFKLSLVAGETIEKDFRRDIEPLVDHIFQLPDALPTKTLLKKLDWSIRKRWQGNPDPRWDDFLKQAEIDFIFPYFRQAKTIPFYQAIPWIPDFQHAHLPQYFTVAELASRNTYMTSMAKQASQIVFSSQTAANDFKNLYPHASAKPHVLRFCTIPQPGWHNEAGPNETQHRYQLPERFFILCNQFWQHKNHGLVFKSLRLLKERGIHPLVVCTGNLHDYRNPGFTNEILESIHTQGLAEQIRLLGIIPRASQIQLIRKSIAVIQPSLFEGWSTVVEDARILGKHLYLSDLAVHREQNPPEVSYFNPHNPDELATLLETGWTNLSVGPNLEREVSAQQAAIEQLQTFAHSFLTLANIPICADNRTRVK
jgi:glycosyltransferase involved in cell wall biosynthesis